ncbi:MAG: class B sortase [Blautia sp.]|nr:class B sortase [Blautia sp.]
MEKSKRKHYAHLYENAKNTGNPAAADGREPGAGDGREYGAGEEYLGDLRVIENLCAHNDLGDAAANKRLYRRLKQEGGFSTWLGEAFLSGLFVHSGEKRRRKTIEKVCKRIAVSFLAMAVVLLAVLLRIQIMDAKESAVLEYIRKEKEQLAQAAEDKKDNIAISKEVEILDQYGIIYSMYPDVVGWLTVEGTGIDYPVMQDISGQEYYLKHSFEGKEDSKGSLFIDAESGVSPLDRNLVIYGHNVSDGSQFGNLDYYLDPDFYKAHSTFTFDTIYETGVYQIVAVVKTRVRQGGESGFRYYWMRGYQNRGEFQELLDFISEESVYDTGEHLSYGDSTVMLSTCEYTVDNGRLVIIAKRMSE